MSEKDIDVLARTIWAEARGEGVAGQVAVGRCIRNRVEADLGRDGKPDWWGEGYVGVCQAPWQFSCWNKNDPNYKYLSGQVKIPDLQYYIAKECAMLVIDGSVPDPTGKATHYYSISMIAPPKWAKHGTYSCRIGRHIFFRDVK